MKLKLSILAFGSFLLSACFGQSKSNPNQAKPNTDFYSLHFLSINGKDIDFRAFKGKKVLIVNTASKCGFTPQYKELQELQDTYKDQLIVLGFPSDNFGGQEYDKNEEIASFCEINYGVTFQLFEKSDVKGKNQNIVFRWLTNASENGWNSQTPSWNFCKYLIDTNGVLLGFFPSKVKPTDESITKLIEK